MKKLIFIFLIIFGLLLNNNNVYSSGENISCNKIRTKGFVRYNKGYKFYSQWNNNDSEKDAYINKREIKHFDFGNKTPLKSSSFLDVGSPFKWSEELENNGFKVPKKSDLLIIETGDTNWRINKKPQKRSNAQPDNYDFMISYNVWYDFSNNYPLESDDKNHIACDYYSVTWCGDGVLDNAYEVCDPLDETKEGWGNKGCNNSCQPINTTNLNTTCDSLEYTKQDKNNFLLTCSGKNVEDYKISCGNGQIINSNKGVCNYNLSGDYNAFCTVNNSITSSACHKKVPVIGQTTAIKVDFLSGDNLLEQKIKVGEKAKFRVKVSNYGEQDLKNIKLFEPFIGNEKVALDCIGPLTKGKDNFFVGDNIVQFSQSEENSDLILQKGEYFTYSCEDLNNIEGNFGYRINVSGVGVEENNLVTDTDLTEVVVEGMKALEIQVYSGNENDLDGDISNNPTNDSQTVLKGNEAKFRVKIKNISSKNINSLDLTSQQIENCSGKLNFEEQKIGLNQIFYSGEGNHLDNIFNPGEIIEYTCSALNTKENYTNTIVALGNIIPGNILVNDTDSTNVLIKDNGGGGEQSIKLFMYSGNSQDQDGDISDNPTNDSQTISNGGKAIFKIKTLNDGTEDLKNINFSNQGVSNCGGDFKDGKVGTNSVVYYGLGNHSNNILEVGEGFYYTCTRENNTVESNNELIVKGNGVNTNELIIKKDSTRVLIGSSGMVTSCKNLEVTPSIGTQNLKSKVICSGNLVSKFKIDCGNGQILNGNGQNSGEESFNGECSYNGVGTYLATCYINDTITNPSCKRNVVVTSSGGGGGGGSTSGGGSHGLSCENLKFGVGSGTGGLDPIGAVVPDITGRNVTFGGTELDIPVTCRGNGYSNTVMVDCGVGAYGVDSKFGRISDIETLGGSKSHTFICKYKNFGETVFRPKCYVGKTSNSVDKSSLKCSGKIKFGGPECNDGVRQNGEECDFGIYNGANSMCSSNCKIQDRTIPNGGSLFFGPNKNEVIIGNGVNPYEKILEKPFILNLSEFDLDLDQLCVEKTLGDSLQGPSLQCVNIGILPPGETATFSSYPNFIGQKDLVPAGKSYQDNILTTTIKNDGVLLTNTFFKKFFKVRVARPSIVTTGGGTSFVKNSSGIADVKKVTDENRIDTSNTGKNDNFIGVSVSTDLSSSTKEIKDSTSIDKVSNEGDKVEQSLNEVIENTGTNVGTTSNINEFGNFNGLSNVFILKNKNFEIQSGVNLGTGPKTFIIENGNLKISSNINYIDNIAFVIKGGNIIINQNVENINGVYITIPKDGNGGKIGGDIENKDKILKINGSLYGNINDLINKRTYINENDSGQLDVGTIVSFGSSVFRKPAPLTGKFIGEYIESQKIAQ